VNHWSVSIVIKVIPYLALLLSMHIGASPTHMVSVEDKRLRGGPQLKQQIWDAAKDTIQRWTGMELEPVSMYGIRVYTEGAILSPHVDRLPLVSSAIVNVAQDVDEPWPLEIYDRQGNAVNVTMEPGDMVLYESGSLLHGRPFPLNGRYFGKCFAVRRLVCCIVGAHVPRRLTRHLLSLL